ncbi:MAG: PDDEXK nuclease domain-containing protein [Kiritimatiellae bacterium]|jgi:predicted nuclease of restriction endonuclease-like (RecB) superfamily|nr:PDDEXK nuclease domain-containing protein [Kiritimatiellia bacterium]MDD3584930.1 PDDEXK nuclease domain-containing protein [Kiritimatiellia bacterium]
MTKRKAKEDHARLQRREEKTMKDGHADPSQRLYDKVADEDSVRQGFYREVAEILKTARVHAHRAANFMMVEAYWNVGKKIVEEEQSGKMRAAYGEFLIDRLSAKLREELGRGFDVTNLKRMRQFYVLFPKGAAAWHLLSWSHFKAVLRLETAEARTWYLQEAMEQNWSVRALERQVRSLYYERLLMSRGKGDEVMSEARQKAAEVATAPEDLIKDPYVLEFLGIPDAHAFRESELEQAIIDKLQAFLLELGKGFAFVARQQRIPTETKDFFIDLVFYNYLLKCFVLIDLKAGELTHQDIGQMDMYVRLYEDRHKNPGDNPTVGLILCTDKDATVVKYSVLSESKQLFASQYRLVLPTEEELRREIERERDLAVREQEERYGGIGRENRASLEAAK